MSMKRLTIMALLAASPAIAQEALRPEVGRPLAKAKSLLAGHAFAAAMAQVRAASAVRGLTANESFVIEEMRGSIAQLSGDIPTAQRTYQAMLDSGRVPASEAVKLMQAEAVMAYQQKNYAGFISWANRYQKAGGRAPEMNTFLIQSYYLSGDYASAQRLQLAQIQAEQRARQYPAEGQLQLLFSCQQKLGDKTGALNTMTQLITYYPKPDYWLNVIDTVRLKPGFNSRLAFDLDRLELSLGLITKTADYMEMAELAIQSQLAGEAKDIVDKGYAAGVLGTGPEAPRQQRLRDLVNKTIAERQKQLGHADADAATDHDGNRLFTLGEEYVSFGQFPKGLPMMEQGLRKDALRHTDDARLHLGLAYYKAGQKARAIQVLRTVGGTEGAADLARLWLLHIGRV